MDLLEGHEMPQLPITHPTFGAEEPIYPDRIVTFGHAFQNERWTPPFPRATPQSLLPPRPLLCIASQAGGVAERLKAAVC